MTSCKQQGCGRKLYGPHHGQMFTLEDLARYTGLSRSGVRGRLAAGIPLDAPFLDTRHERVELNGRRVTVQQAARELGVHPRVIRRRAANGEALDAPPGHGESWDAKPLKAHAATEADDNITNDSLPFDQDKRAQLVRRYFANKQPVHTDAEIRAEFADLCQLSDAAVAAIREWLCEEMFTARKTRDGEQLEIIGEIFGVSRERVRQDESRARERMRRHILLQDDAADIIDELRERDARGDASYAALCDLMSPGHFDEGIPGRKSKNPDTVARRFRNGRNRRDGKSAA